MRLIHVFVDNASYHKADIVKSGLRRPRKIVLHFLPPYCPHLDPINVVPYHKTHPQPLQTFASSKRDHHLLATSAQT